MSERRIAGAYESPKWVMKSPGVFDFWFLRPRRPAIERTPCAHDARFVFYRSPLCVRRPHLLSAGAYRSLWDWDERGSRTLLKNTGAISGFNAKGQFVAPMTERHERPIPP